MDRIFPAALGIFIYVVVYLALRLLPNQDFAGYFNTAAQAASDAAGTVFAFSAARIAGPKWRGFFGTICAASGLMLVSNVAWGFVINIWALDPMATLVSLSYRVPYLLCLALWVWAWLEVVVRNVNRNAGIALFGVSILVGGFLAALLIEYYQPLLTALSSNPHRVFVFLYVGLEIAALICCVSSGIGQVHPYPLLIAVGYALLVACDFIFNTNELRNDVPQNSLVEIPWTVSQVLIALGVRAHSFALRGRYEPSETLSSANFAVPLLSITLGSGLIGALIALFVQPQTLALACYLFASVVTALVISVVVRAHGAARSRALRTIQAMTVVGSDEAAIVWDEILRLFGTADLFERIRIVLLSFKGNVLPCDDDRLFSLSDAWRAKQTEQVFIAMPYSLEWSDTIDEWIRSVVADFGWIPVRGDELFDSRDVVDGLWRGICSSRAVVADLTGRNPNVMYEIGIAHCLAKPVILVCQSLDDIPFDLANKRVVIYRVDKLEVATSRLRRALAAVREVGATMVSSSGERDQHAGRSDSARG
ncbi:hypothetical protein ACNJX9_09345 [Bradyrhizobium sp. DASA03076]|uniref:hypothetical protein n=1 Tax=Bradyrhizobium sp. BLXBL-03 TaxID=3395916 RepID=UPI003F711DA0